MFRALLVLLVAICLAACGLTEGYVTEKHDYPGHYYTYMQPIYGQQCVFNNKTTSCYPVVISYIPIQEWAPERWTVVIKLDKETAEHDVTPDIYRRANIGDVYNDKTKELRPS